MAVLVETSAHTTEAIAVDSPIKKPINNDVVYPPPLPSPFTLEWWGFILQSLWIFGFWVYPSFPIVCAYLVSLSPFSAYWTLSLLFFIVSCVPQMIGVPIFAVIGYYQWPTLEQYRCHQRAGPWLWSSANKNDTTREQARDLLRRALGNNIGATIAQAIQFPVLVWLLCGRAEEGSEGTCSARLSMFQSWIYETSWHERLFDSIIMMLIFETGFYFLHRMVHVYPSLYQYHKQHHEFYQPCVLAGLHMSNIDKLYHIVIPSIMVIVYTYVKQSHIYNLAFFALQVNAHTIADHCGYDFPFNPFDLIPFARDTTRMHDLHHSANTGNYGVMWSFWDRWMGTLLIPKRDISYKTE